VEAHALVSTLRIFVPASERFDAATEARWVLLERRAIVREGRSVPGEMPRADDVEAILPASRVLFARLALPRVSDTTIRELLPFAVEDRLLADPAQVHAVAGSTDERGETLVAVVDRTWLSALLRWASETGRTPRHAWCESALVPTARSEWHVVLGEATGMLVDGSGAATTFDWHRGSGVPLAIRIALDEAGERGERPERIRVHEAFAHADDAGADLAGWGRDASIAFERSRSWQELEATAATTGAIDLLAGDFAARRRGVGAVRIPRAAIALAAALVLLQLGFTAFDTMRLQRERTRLDAEREAIFRSAFPEARVVVDPELQMTRNLAQLRASRGLAGGDDFLVRLTAAARESEQPAARIDYARGQLSVQRASGAGGAR
jgi:general secretion pathway protein L